MNNAPLAQWLEQSAQNAQVVGSSPTRRTKATVAKRICSGLLFRTTWVRILPVAPNILRGHMKRFYKAMIILTALGLQACPETPVKSEVVGNGVNLDILFEHDGCRVYRFYDYKDPTISQIVVGR